MILFDALFLWFIWICEIIIDPICLFKSWIQVKPMAPMERARWELSIGAIFVYETLFLTSLWLDLSWRPFPMMIWICKIIIHSFLIQNVDPGGTNGTDGTSSLRAFDRCHICLWNHNFDLIIAWFWSHPKFWFEIGIKSWFDLNWFDLIWRNFLPKIMIWFDLTPCKKVRDLIWFEMKSFLCRFDLIWFEFAHPCSQSI